MHVGTLSGFKADSISSVVANLMLKSSKNVTMSTTFIAYGIIVRGWLCFSINTGCM